MILMAEMNYNEVKRKVFSILEDKLGIDMNDFNENSSYSNDLGADSLDAVELMMEFESYFEIIVKDEEFEMFTTNSTIKQSIDFITSKLNTPILNEQKMKVKCINQSNYKDITVGNEYEIKEELENFYHIIANSGNVRSYNKKYFELVSEPIIEDIDEIGVEENQEDEINITFNGEEDIAYEVNGNDATLELYEVASNCGVKSYHGVNYLFENCDCNKDLFKKVIEEIIEEVIDRYNSCMLIFSTNSSYMDIWTVLDEVMDFSSEIVENPNSDMDVKLWIKYTN